jgi:hypothetical protein
MIKKKMVHEHAFWMIKIVGLIAEPVVSKMVVAGMDVKLVA